MNIGKLGPATGYLQLAALQASQHRLEFRQIACQFDGAAKWFGQETWSCCQLI